MAGTGWIWTKSLAVAVLFFSATAAIFTQSPVSGSTGSLTGRLTDLHFKPLDRVTVTVRNKATRAEARAITQKNGTYRFSGLEPGEYTLAAESSQLGHGQIEGIVVTIGYEARVQVALHLEPGSAEQTPTVAREAEPRRVGDAVARQILPIVPDVNATEILSQKVWVPQVPLLGPGKLQIPLSTTQEAVAPELTARLSFEPLETLALTGRSLKELSPQLAPVVTGAMGQAVQSALNVSKTEAVEDTNTLTADELQMLPVGGRRWQNFVLDTQSSTAGSQVEQHSTVLAVDGVRQGLAFGGRNEAVQGSDLQGRTIEDGSDGRERSAIGKSWTGGHGFAMSEAAILEVQTATGYDESAAIRSGGGQMNVATKQGSNGLHGQGFLFDRQNDWGAKNPFTQWVQETAKATLTTVPAFTSQAYSPSDHEMTLGFGLGSQILRDKLFWFAALDSFHRNDPGVAMVKHPELFFAQPTNDQMQVLSARLGLSSVNPVAEGLAAYSSILETLDGLLGPAPRTSSQWAGFARLDWQATERQRFTLEGTGAHADAPGGGLSRVSETYGSHSFGSTRAGAEWLMVRWESFVTPNLLLVSQGSAGRGIQEAHSETPSAYEQTLLTGNAWGQLPQITVDSRYGFTIGNLSRFGQGSYPDERRYQGQAMLDWVRGKLLVKAGFDVSHNWDATSLLRNQTGTYSYSSVENFASDALAFVAFGTSGQLNPDNQHNCDQTGKVWRDSSGQLHGLGYLPCYSYYSQMIGPANWWLSTNDWTGFSTVQWQSRKQIVLSAGLRLDWEQTPSSIAKLDNPALPLTEKLPALGNNWGPRFGLAMGSGDHHWPELRLGYGMYFGQTANATLETALTQTGSLKGDLYFFLRPTDNLNAGGAPSFPSVLTEAPGSVVKPGAAEFARGFRNPETHQAEASIEEKLHGHVELTASAELSLGRRLPISVDTNIDPAAQPQTITYAVEDSTGLGPIKSTQITVPFYTARLNSNYQQIAEIMSRANSTYEAATLNLVQKNSRGLSLRAHYTYAHAMDWNPNDSSQVAGNDVLDPASFKEEYGTGDLDVRHSAAATVIWESPWRLHDFAGMLGNGWIVSGIGQFRSGRPYTMRTSGALPKEFNPTTGAAIVGLGSGMNGSGGDNRVYGLGNDNRTYDIGRNTYRYPATWKADLRLTRRFNLEPLGKLELLVESFNLFNHQNVTQLEATGYSIEPGSMNGALPTLNFLTGLKVNTTAFGQPLSVNATNFYRERQIQLGLRFRY
jgi:hypothetical protein